MTQKIIFTLLACVYFQAAIAQHQATFDKFRQETGDYAALFQGKIERGYSSSEYANHPYWLDKSFHSGSVSYKGLLYSELSLRYDTYLHQLIVNTPVKKTNISIDMTAVDYFIINQIKFVRQEHKFVALHYESSRMRLIQTFQCGFGTPITKNQISYKNFKQSSQYYLQQGEQSYEVKSLASVQKLFPQHKKQLKQFAKEKQLNFKEKRTAALTALIRYADQIRMQEP